MILAAMVIARNPSQYGFDFEPETAPEIDKVTLPRPVDLRRVAEWTDTTIDHIQALNPELRRWTTPVKDTKYQLKVPAGTAAIVTARLSDAPSADLASLKYYTVKRGETLLTIARKLRVSRADLAEANYLRMTARVAAGQKLMVPHEATVLMAARAERPAPATEARTTVTAVRPARARGGKLEPGEGELRGPARRHARVHRPPVQDDRRVDQELESAASGHPADWPASA